MSKRGIETHKKNLFEIDNARNLSRDELVSTFVPTQTFWRLLSAEHHVVLGSRGSGKTAVAKMLSHDHLSRVNDQRCRAIVQLQSLIGIYVPTRLEWVSGLKNKPWMSEGEKERYFQWRLNLACCSSFLLTVSSCLEQYGGDKGVQAEREYGLCAELSRAWLPERSVCHTVKELLDRLEDIEYEKQQEILFHRSKTPDAPYNSEVGVTFEMELLQPLKRGITLLARSLGIRTDCAWLLCLDEAEFLDALHHRIVNSHMRAFTDRLFIKMTTMPYCHYTLNTNTDVTLDVGQDFEYVYMDLDPTLFSRSDSEVSKFGTRFGRTLFNRRAVASGFLDDTSEADHHQGVYVSKGRGATTTTVSDLLGSSRVLDARKEDWSPNSPNMSLLRRYASEETKERARRLKGTDEFNEALGRKIRGALLIREAWEQYRGNVEPDVYSGASMILRCSDSNPRRLIRLFNALLLPSLTRHLRRSRSARIPPKEQNRVLYRFSESVLNRVQSEPDVGRELYELLTLIGDYMHSRFHDEPVSTDQITSLSITSSPGEAVLRLIRRAVGWGLLYPNVSWDTNEDLPVDKGTFHLAYVLAPRFFLLPRRGRARSLTTILSGARGKTSLAAYIAGSQQSAIEFPEEHPRYEGDDSVRRP